MAHVWTAFEERVEAAAHAAAGAAGAWDAELEAGVDGLVARLLPPVLPFVMPHLWDEDYRAEREAEDWAMLDAVTRAELGAVADAADAMDPIDTRQSLFALGEFFDATLSQEETRRSLALLAEPTTGAWGELVARLVLAYLRHSTEDVADRIDAFAHSLKHLPPGDLAAFAAEAGLDPSYSSTHMGLLLRLLGRIYVDVLSPKPRDATLVPPLLLRRLCDRDRAASTAADARRSRRLQKPHATAARWLCGPACPEGIFCRILASL